MMGSCSLYFSYCFDESSKVSEGVKPRLVKADCGESLIWDEIVESIRVERLVFPIGDGHIT